MAQKIIVNKFGGGILNKELIPFIIERLKEQKENGYQPMVVVSALPGVTDNLFSFLEQGNKSEAKGFVETLKEKHYFALEEIGLDNAFQEKARYELDKLFSLLGKDLKKAVKKHDLAKEDRVISYGEKLSTIVLSSYLNSHGMSAKEIFAENIPIVTDNHFKNSNIISTISTKNVEKTFREMKEIPVIAGFTGITEKGQTTTLGRGGTDTTACFIGSALKAEKIILWKDVGGVLSADPKIVAEAKTIPYISYQEAEESGKIIHDKAIQYPKLYKTPVEIASLNNPSLKTEIVEIKNQEAGAKIVSYKKNLTLFLITEEKIKGVDLLSIVSQIFYKYRVDVILISNTRYSLQIVAEDSNGLADKVLAELKAKVSQIETYPVSMVFLVGNFGVQDVNDFNSLLIDLKTDMEISAFLYKNCTRLEAVIKTQDISGVVKELYKKFIK